MKKKLFAILPAALILCSCDFNLDSLKFWENWTEDNTNKTEQVIDDVETDDYTEHASKVSCEPKAPFYLRYGETKTLKVSFDKTPTLDEEKIFEWSTESDCITFTVDETDSKKATVVGVKEGTAILTAKNTYNQSLIGTFTIKVIDFDSENMYLWQYDAEDRKQFGYDSANAKLGTESGTAVLNGKQWNYTRNKTTSLQTESGAIGFGKGKDPETLVTLTSKNTRTIKAISLETSSANGLANCTVKIGETEIINKKTPAFKDKQHGMLSNDDELNLKGDISIKYETPEFDQDAYDADPIGYRYPGAVYLKSIFIIYEEETEPEYRTVSELNFEEMFSDPETYSEFWFGINGTAKEKDYEQDRISYHFDKIKKDNTEGKNTLFNINAPITINVPEGEVISKVEFKYQIFGTSSIVYGATGSMVGGEPYSFTLSAGTLGECSFRVFDPYIYTVKLSSTSTTNVGLKSLVVKTVDGTHLGIDGINFPEGAVPTKCSYAAGEKFDPTGLPNAIAFFKQPGSPNLEIPAECFEFYDGASYDADSNTATDVLTAGSTYVYAKYKEHFVCKIEGITVEDVKTTFKEVKTLEDLGEGGSFLFVNKATKSYWKGTSSTGSNMKGSEGVGTLNIDALGDTIEIPPLVGDEVINVTKTSGAETYKINTSKLKIGLTPSNDFSIAGSPAFEEWEISLNGGAFEFKITGDTEKSGSVKYLIFDEKGLKFNISTTAKNNIALYKLADK